MNAELLYTSAPQGLKQGSRGFCTVLSTVGMPLNIATKLESLSGYRHLHPSGTPEAARNPVNHSHMKLTVGGRTLSVISRISDYGLDYSKRTNKLAHHIVVDSPMPTCGPAALLGDPSLMRSEWDGICLNIPTPPAIPSLTVEPAHCSLWESMTGDAGWAGVLANGWLNPTNKPIFIVFSEDQSTQLLALIAQAIALLPTAKRWQATFGTYVTNLPPDVDCKVRCVVAGSDEARMASARGVVIDLTRPCGPAPSSEAATAARNGVLIGSQSNSQPSSVSADPSGSPQELERVATEEQESERPGRLVEKPPTSELDPDRPFEAQVPGPPPEIRPGTRRIAPPRKTKNPSPKPSISFARIAAIAIGLIFCSIIGLAYYLSQNPWLKGLNIVATETKPKQSTVDQRKPDVPETSGQEEKSNPTVAGKPNPAPMLSQQPSDPPKSLLKPDEIVIRLANPKRKLDTPVAIRGESIEATFDSTKPSLTEEEKAFLGELQEKSQRSWFAIRKKSGEPRNLGSNSNLDVPADTAEEQVFLEAKYNGETWTSNKISIIDQAQESDFKLSLTDFTINGKNIPFGLPGSQISAEVELANTREDSQEYLSSLVSTVKLSWRSKSTETPLSADKEYTIPEKTSLSDIFAVARIGDGSLSLQSESRSVIGRISGELECKNTSSGYLVIKLDKPNALENEYDVLLGDKNLKDDFLVSELIDMKNQEGNEIRKIETSVNNSINNYIKLASYMDKITNITKGSKSNIHRDLAIDPIRERLPLGSIEKDMLSGKTAKKIRTLKKIEDLFEISKKPKEDFLKKIADEFSVSPDTKEDPRADERSFLIWLREQTNTSGKSIFESIRENIELSETITKSIEYLKGGQEKLVDSKLKLKVLEKKGNSEVGKKPFAEVSIPLELIWVFPTEQKRPATKNEPSLDSKVESDGAPPTLDAASANAIPR
jgi:hypothetical protein